MVYSFLKWIDTQLLGRIAYRLRCAEQKYLCQRNTRAVHNEGSIIGGECTLGYPENIYIGKNSYVNGGQLSASPHAKIIIGDDCLISYCVHLRTDMHNYSDPQELIRQQGHTEKDIVIGNDVWVGYGAQIMSGVTVADGCVIAAGAVVTHDKEPYGVYGGVPARLIKHRGE